MPPGITVYDGADCIGGNKIYLSDGKDGIFLDFGKNFGKYARFYEEFLKSGEESIPLEEVERRLGLAD